MAKRTRKGVNNRFARRRLVKRQRRLTWAIAIGIPVLCLVAGIFIGVKVHTYTQQTKINDYGRTLMFAAYTVQDGDTIWSIAQDLSALNPEYNDIRQYVFAIEKANAAMDGEIRQGQTLFIPYYANPDGSLTSTEIYAKYGIGR